MNVYRAILYPQNRGEGWSHKTIYVVSATIGEVIKYTDARFPDHTVQEIEQFNNNQNDIVVVLP